MTNWEHAAGIVWPLLTKAARAKRTITYGRIAPTIPTIPVSVGKALGPIQDYCLENRLPPLTAIVVGVTGKPGSGFIAWDVDDLATAHKKVFSYNWANIPNPYGKFGVADTIESLGGELAKHPSRGRKILRLVKDRGIFQKIFREALLHLYGKCSMCGLTFVDALQAAHILPWPNCSDNEKTDVRNGLLLCAVHHSLFDSNWISVSNTNKINFSDMAMADGPYSTMDLNLTVRLNNKKLHLPENRKNWPRHDYFQRRRKLLDGNL